ncbi:MAG TPA: ABC transporter permease [Sulfitobacter pontiacus]|jgi:peptide/nickel transport system permease protein|uniref:Peptide/nickel transport system permease protein n=1 Tax=Sulfitobacter pontiacus TaxID=60137 RepID=A0A1H3E637_9RHOB|nr:MULTISPECIES: ABC transporter permease [Sulfitobacter]MCP3879643.1 ABC transporter permease [Sulfitobacter sp.]NKX48719.1 ABC transporter permease [Rhodobacteraceae bacterium R_SAG8]EAP79718.1 peptide ABC transporter, permease protein [Sulfitobacter sp. NAS-14.1]OAN77009.1 peptide ABC transporter permease [Sulfitobacter pontiacus]QLL44117.1 ABC transporter permease [Sulfitobacter pontiacus]|tara:strand:+ start:288 stop:1160 length:873 start_codon:yes stop_codon:yes gene_type:complete
MSDVTIETARPSVWRKMRGNTGALIGGTLLAAIILIALLAPLLAPHDPIAQDLSRRLLPPFWHDRAVPEHLLGTDHLGRDYLSRMIYGARVSLGVGLGVILVSGAIGITLGLIAGYFGGWIDMVISFAITTRLSLPIVLVALAAVALGGASLTTLITVLGLLLWDRFAVVTRAAAQSLRHQEFIMGLRSIGASRMRILFLEILPNMRATILVVVSLEVANVILLEAALSFLGLGVRPPTPSWGLMISEGRDNILFDPWLIALPGSALCLLVLAVNLFGDGMRDITGPARK